MKAFFTSLVLVFFCATTNCKAQNLKELGIDSAHVPAGLPVGARAPLFKAKNTQGEIVNLRKLMKNNPVVLIFYRGHWCPVCDKHLAHLTDSLAQIKAAGADVVFVTPNTADNATKTNTKFNNLMQTIPDSDGSIMRAYAVDFVVTEQYQKKIKRFLKADIAAANNQENAVLPVPATYIIGEQGLILWRHFNLNYKNRASAGAILRHLP